VSLVSWDRLSTRMKLSLLNHGLRCSSSAVGDLAVTQVWPSTPGQGVKTLIRSCPDLKSLLPHKSQYVLQSIHGHIFQSPQNQYASYKTHGLRSPESSGFHQILRDYLLYLLFQMQFTSMPSYGWHFYSNWITREIDLSSWTEAQVLMKQIWLTHTI